MSETIDSLYITTKSHKKFRKLVKHLKSLGLEIKGDAKDPTNNSLVIWNKGLKGRVTVSNFSGVDNRVKIKALLKTETIYELFEVIDSISVE